MAAAKEALNGDPSALEQLLVGRRIWVVVPPLGERGDHHVYDCVVLSFHKFLPAGPVGEGEPHATGGTRKKHLVKLWTDPGGTRVLSVGSIRMKDPGRVDAALRRYDAAASPV